MNRLTHEADDLIRKVVARYNSIYTPERSVSQIDLDLMLDDLRLLYEKFRLISQLNLQHKYQESKKSPPVVQPAEPKQQSASVADELPTDTAVEPVRQTPEQRSSSHSPEPEKPAPNTPAENPGERVDPEPAPKQQQADPIHSTLADRFKNEQRSLSDVITTGQDDSIGSKLGHSPIADLKSVIGLAEKFAFINELFSGDPLAYEKAIVQLNSASHLSEAETYLNTLRLNYKWPADSPQAGLLTEIIRRKYS